MIEKVVEILKNFTDVSEINADSRLVADLALSSLDVVNIIVEFEDAFDIEIPDEDIRTFQTVRDIVDYLGNV